MENRKIHPIVHNDEILFENIILFIKLYFKKAFKNSLIVILFFCLYFFLKPDTYISKVSFYTNYQESIQSSVLSMVPNFLSGGIKGNSLDFSVSNYITSDKFLNDIVSETYQIDGADKTLVDHWGAQYNNFLRLNFLKSILTLNKYIMYSKYATDYEKKSLHASLVLANSISFSEDRRTQLNQLSIEIKNDPSLSEQIVRKMYNSILSYSNEIVNTKASEKKDFISERLLIISDQLRKDEEKLLSFMEKNKNINFSPSLTLQKDRLQRNISLNEQLFFTLSDQLELAKINEKDNTSSFFLLDSPKTYPMRPGISLLKGCVYLFILTLLFIYSIKFFKHRKLLFIIDESLDT